MPGRRPTPLSDELFIPECSAPAPMLLGATNNGMPLPVKNTFLDVPSGLTPTSLKNEWCKPLLTAPAGMSKPLAFPVQAATNPAPGLNVEKTPARPGALQPYTGTPPATPATGAAVLTPTRVLLIQAPGAVATTPGTESEAVAPGASVPAALARTPQRLQVMGVSVAATTPSHTSVRSAPSLPEPPASPGRVLASSWSPPQQPAGQTLARQLFEQPLQEVAGAEDPDESDSDSDDDEVVPQHLRQVESAPKPPPGALHPSVGSRTHMSGLCKRCCFFPRGRCANGYECEFCHYEHDKRKRKNKKKRTKVMAMRTAGHLSTSERQRLRISALTSEPRSRANHGRNVRAAASAASMQQMAASSRGLAAYCPAPDGASMGPMIVQGCGGQQFLMCAPAQVCSMPGHGQPAAAPAADHVGATAAFQLVGAVGTMAGAMHEGFAGGRAAPLVAAANNPGQPNMQVVLQSAPQQAMHVVMMPFSMQQQQQQQQQQQPQLQPHSQLLQGLVASSLPQRLQAVQQAHGAPTSLFMDPPPAPSQPPRLQRSRFELFP